jgi:hypothetical protein
MGFFGLHWQNLAIPSHWKVSIHSDHFLAAKRPKIFLHSSNTALHSTLPAYERASRRIKSWLDVQEQKNHNKVIYAGLKTQNTAFKTPTLQKVKPQHNKPCYTLRNLTREYNALTTEVVVKASGLWHLSTFPEA